MKSPSGQQKKQNTRTLLSCLLSFKKKGKKVSWRCHGTQWQSIVHHSLSLSHTHTHTHTHSLSISLTPIHSLYLSLPQTHSFCSFKRLFLISYFTLDRFSQTHALSCNPPLYLFFYCSLQSGNEQRSMFDHRRPIL